MPNQQINSITSATTTDGSELLPVVSGGVTKSVSVSTINSGIAADAVSDVYEARDLAVGQSSIAAAAALAAGSIAQQDLTAVSATLHRSPNAVTSMFVYDTTKDSDGGAWTEKCQHTSWYNETLSGKWLGDQQNEFQARNINSSLGPELVSNGSFSNGISGWEAVSITGTASISESNGVCNINLVSGFNLGIATTASILTAGKIYRVEFNYTKGSVPGDSLAVGANAEYTMPVYNGVNSGYFYATTSGKLTIRSIGAFTLSPGVLFSIDNISVREVTALNTTSGDYFQLTTDGKFYRLWKNLYKYSQQFDISPWVTNNTATVSANVATAPDGTQTADALYETTTTSSHYVMQDAPVIAGLQYTVQFRVAPNGRTRVAIAGTSSIGGGIGAGIFFELIGVGSVIGTPAGTATIKQDAAGFYLISYTWTAANTGAYLLGVFLVDSGTQTSYTGDPTKGVYLWGAQFEQNSTATSYELKTVDGTISEVFRGNKREFPKLSAIVAEASNVTIYDLTEPGRPMWMRFTTSGSWTYKAINGLSLTGISSVNSTVAVTHNGNSGSLSLLSFAGDSVKYYRNNNDYSTNVRAINIAARQATTAPGAAIETIPVFGSGGQGNAVAMTVLPDAPVDPVTGLQVPTIAVATAGGVSVIKHNGTVASSAEVVNFSQVTLTPQILSVGGGSAGRTWRYVLNPGTVGSGFLVTGYVVQGDPSEWQRGAGVPLLKASSRSQMVRTNTAEAMLVFRKNQENAVSKAVHATITNTYNTGHMVGDIRRTYLADTAVGSVYSPALTMQNMITTAQQGVWYDPSDFTTLFQDSSGNTPVTAVEQSVGLILDKSKNRALGPELVTNGNFSNGSTGWVLNAATVTDGKLVVTNASNFAYQTGILTAGKWYYVELDVTYTVGAELRINTSVGIPETGEIRWLVTNGKLSGIFRSSGTLLSIEARTSLFTGTIDNVSVKEVLGNHAFQPTAGSRPVLSARYNLLRKTEQFDDAYWEKSSGNGGSLPSVTADYEAGPYAGTLADRVQFTRTTTSGSFSQLSFNMSSTLTVGATYIASIWMKSRTGSVVVDMGSFNAAYGAYKPTVTTEWQRFSYQWTVTSASSRFGPLLYETTGTAETADLLVWGADLRVANDALNMPAYQRVNTDADYDTVGFKPYLKFNGSSQWMQTNSIDFTATDKMFVSAGVRKLSDTTPGIVSELSTVASTTNGAFYVAAPDTTGTYGFGLRGTSSINRNASGYTAPSTNVLSASYDIAQSSASSELTLRINGTVPGSIANGGSADAGTGNFGNYPLYVGARAGSSLYFNGRIYQLVIVNKIPTADELKSTETTINRKTLAYAE